LTPSGSVTQAPSTGRLQRLLGPLYFNGAFWYRFHFWASNSLPTWFLAAMIRVWGGGFFLALTDVRRSLRANLRLVDPKLRWWAASWRAYKTVHTFSWCVSERNQQFSKNAQLEVAIEGREAWEQASRAGRGVIVVTSHIGGWEIASAVAAANKDKIPIHVVREREADPLAQEFMEELLRGQGLKTFQTHFASDDPSLGMELCAALRRGEIVALQGDRPRQSGPFEWVDFFGQEVALPPGPAQLARLAEVSLLPVFTFREGLKRYRIVIRDPIEVARTSDRRSDVRGAVQALARVIEEAIRSHPEQWFCFNRIGHEPGSKKVLNSPEATQTPAESATSKL
jgi:lauroyl/myristoyl acyltransferase